MFCTHTWYKHNGMDPGTFCTNCGMVTLHAPPDDAPDPQERPTLSPSPVAPAKSMARKLLGMFSKDRE